MFQSPDGCELQHHKRGGNLIKTRFNPLTGVSCNPIHFAAKL